MKKISVGTQVLDGDGKICEVIYHGRDKNGVYTRVKYPNGVTKDWHRDYLKEIK